MKQHCKTCHCDDLAPARVAPDDCGTHHWCGPTLINQWTSEAKEACCRCTATRVPTGGFRTMTIGGPPDKGHIERGRFISLER